VGENWRRAKLGSEPARSAETETEADRDELAPKEEERTNSVQARTHCKNGCSFPPTNTSLCSPTARTLSSTRTHSNRTPDYPVNPLRISASPSPARLPPTLLQHPVDGTG
jgi:hypothetical protein